MPRPKPHASDPSAPRASTASPAQRRANRRNAKRSTGPRTEAGKRRASLNAVTHGLFCSDPVLPGEDSVQYVKFRNGLLNARGLRPQDELELSIAEQYVLARWRLRRLPGAEAGVHERLAREVCEETLDDIIDLTRSERDVEDPDADPDDYAYDADADAARAAELAEHIANDRAEADERARSRGMRGRSRVAWSVIPRPRGEEHIPVSATLAKGFMHPDSGPFERMGRYQHRLELSAQRALRELRQHRKDLDVNVADLPECPFLTPVEEAPEHEPVGASAIPSGGAGSPTPSDAPPVAEHDSSVQNEPNSTALDAAPVATEGCDEGSCNIELIAMTKLAPRGAGGVSDVERKERDRT